MISFQTNYASMVAQQNLGTNSNFQTKTIEALTSGYRINSSGDDPAGLAVANAYAASVAELTQGVINANSGVSTLQIMDGGLSNISTILNRLQTLATESASNTFTGNRTTVNNEYQTLLGEINRQATNIGLSTGGANVGTEQVYIGGASSANSNAQVSIDLTNGAVDTMGLKLAGTSVIGGGVGFANDTTNLNDTSANFLNSSNGGAGSETFTFNYADATGTLHSGVTATVASQAGGYTGAQAVTAVNTALAKAGINNITASIGSSGALQFSGPAAFTVTTDSTFANSPAAGNNSTSIVNGAATMNSYNSGIYTLNAAVSAGAAAAGQEVSFSVGGNTYDYTLQAGDTTAATLATNIMSATDASGQTLASAGVYAIANAAGDHILLTSANAFTADNVAQPTAGAGSGGLFTSNATIAAVGGETVTAPSADASATGNALLAINAVTAAVQALGSVQGTIGAGENQLNYAISLANSQMTNDASAESQIRDADIATEAANLTKAQVLEQASVAAMAQANTTPQALLKLLQ